MAEPQIASGGEHVTQSQLEEMFKLRYTDNDVKYMDTLNKALASPPCLQNWYSRPKRIFDFASRGQSGNRSHGGQWRDNRDRREWNRDRDYNQRDRDSHQRDRDYQDQRYRSDREHQGHGHRDNRDQQGYGQQQPDHCDRGNGHGKQDTRNKSGRVYYAGVSHSNHQSGRDSWT